MKFICRTSCWTVADWMRFVCADECFGRQQWGRQWWRRRATCCRG